MRKTNISLLLSAGTLNILLGIFHLGFWHIFNWKSTLQSLELINRNIMIMLNYCLAVLLLGLGLLLISYRKKILEDTLGRAVLLTVAGFYLLRLILEFLLPGSSFISGIILIVMLSLYAIPLITSDFKPYGAAEVKM